MSAKTKQPKEPVAATGAIEQWLESKDEELYEKGAQIALTRKRCANDLGGKISPKRFKECRDKVCKYWKVRRRPKESAATSLDWRQWDKFRQWCLVDEHRETIRNARSIKFVALLMRSEGLVASAYLLRNSASFMTTWKEVRS